MGEKKEIDVPKLLLYGIELIAFALTFFYFYSSRNENSPVGIYNESAQKETVKSLITALKLQNVHDVPVMGLTPRIQVYIKEDKYFVNTYYLEIIRGSIIVKDGVSNQTDIVIRTTQDEILKTINDTTYMKESLSSGRTVVTKTTSNFVLFTEGYPSNFLK
jgi:hypothetical protein